MARTLHYVTNDDYKYNVGQKDIYMGHFLTIKSRQFLWDKQPMDLCLHKPRLIDNVNESMTNDGRENSYQFVIVNNMHVVLSVSLFS